MLENRDFKLPRKEIIKKSPDFQRVLQQGVRWEGKIIKCFYIKADTRKVGFIVPKRLGNAVYRNRIKRLMREVYRHHKYDVEKHWVLIMAKRTGKYPRLKEIENEFCQFIKTAFLMS